MGIETRFGDVKNLRELEQKIDSKTKLIFCESMKPCRKCYRYRRDFKISTQAQHTFIY